VIKLRRLKPELGRLCSSKKNKKELRRRLNAIKISVAELGKHLRAKWPRMLAKRTSTSVLGRATRGEKSCDITCTHLLSP
jgi:hypothetical protein